MLIRRIGLAICLMGSAYTVCAGYAWSDFDAKATAAGTPTAQTNGYHWSELRAQTNGYHWSELRAQTNGYHWSELRAKAPAAERPAAQTHGYAWSD